MKKLIYILSFTMFTDPCLQQLIDSALAKNTNLLTAALSVSQAKAMLKAARLAFWPAFQIGASGTLSSWDMGKATQIYSLPLEGSWSVDLFGSLTNAKRAQQAAMLQAQDYQRAVQTGLISQIANAYYTLLMLDRQLEITRNTEQLTKKTYDLMVAQKKLAGADESAVQSARANYLSVQASIPEIERQIRETENALSVLLCEAPHQIPRGKLDQQSLPETFSVGVPVQVLSNRPDVHAAEMKLANCYYNVNRARAAFYPALTISGQAAWTNSGGMGITNPGKWLLSAVGSLVQPIFQNGQLVAGLRVAKDQYQQAYNTWQNSVFKAGNEVSNALALYNASEQKSKLEAHQIEVLKQNVEDTRALMGSSTSTYLEVITAQSSLLNVQLSKVQDDFSKMQAVVDLYYALGGGAN